VESIEAQLPHHPDGPEAAFDRAWAMEVVARAQRRLAEELAAKNEAAFRVVQRFFVPGSTPSYEEAAEHAGMSLAGFRSFLHRARQRLRELIRREVTPTVRAGRDVGSEVSDLMDALRA
jgi:DNA-directed RNA polymerase specialized sigma24 family protein